jgi:hypothetical protein
MRDLLYAAGRLDHAETADGAEREALLKRVRTGEQDVSRKIKESSIQLARAEGFAASPHPPGRRTPSAGFLGLTFGQPAPRAM